MPTINGINLTLTGNPQADLKTYMNARGCDEATAKQELEAQFGVPTIQQDQQDEDSVLEIDDTSNTSTSSSDSDDDSTSYTSEEIELLKKAVNAQNEVNSAVSFQGWNGSWTKQALQRLTSARMNAYKAGLQDSDFTNYKNGNTTTSSSSSTSSTSSSDSDDDSNDSSTKTYSWEQQYAINQVKNTYNLFKTSGWTQGSNQYWGAYNKAMQLGLNWSDIFG